VENDLTGTGSTAPTRGVSSSYPKVDRRRCTNWLRFSLSRDSLQLVNEAKLRVSLRHLKADMRAVEVGCGIGFKLPTLRTRIVRCEISEGEWAASAPIDSQRRLPLMPSRL